MGERAAAFAARDAAADDDEGGANAAASVIRRLEARKDAEADEVRDRVRRLEREKPGALGKGVLPASALDQRRAAFERADGERDAGGNVREKAAAFVGDRAEQKTRATGVLDRKGVFERGDRDARKEEEEEEANRKEKAVIAERQKMQEEQRRRDIKAKDEAEAHIAKASTNISQRFAMFEGGGGGGGGAAAADAKPKEAVKPATTTRDVVGSKGASAPPAKKAATARAGMEPDALLSELQQVKTLNHDLVSRLVELTGAFKRLEKSREQLQARVAKLEKK